MPRGDCASRQLTRPSALVPLSPPLPTPELFAPHGYPLEEHFSLTCDGYVLGLYRTWAPDPKPNAAEGGVEGAFGSNATSGGGAVGVGAALSDAPSRSKLPPPHARPAVFLFHGLLDSSATWALNGPNASLAFLLADAGFDVWMGNARGNAYSRHHAWLNPDELPFWDFSIDQIARYDIPAMIAKAQANRRFERGGGVGTGGENEGPMRSDADGVGEGAALPSAADRFEDLVVFVADGAVEARRRLADGTLVPAALPLPTNIPGDSCALPRVGPWPVDRVSYVGHSQGTTSFLEMAAFDADARHAVSSAALLAPVASLRGMTSLPLAALATARAADIVARLGLGEFMPRSVDGWPFVDACETLPSVCVNAMAAFCGYDERHVPVARMRDYAPYAPSGSSVTVLAHWGQLVRESMRDPGTTPRTHIRQYDFGPCAKPGNGSAGGSLAERSDPATHTGAASSPTCPQPRRCNGCEYGWRGPAEAPISALASDPASPRVSLFYGGNDALADPSDVAALSLALGSALGNATYLPTYAHLDFVWGVTAAEDVYVDLIKELRAGGDAQRAAAAR